MGNPQVFLFFVPGKLMAALAYRDDKFLARNLLPYPFFCLTPAEPFFRPDRSSTAPSCRVAVKDGRAFRGHPKGLSLTAARTMARWRSRGGRHAWQRSRPRHHGDRRGFPVPVPAVSTEVRELLSGSPSIISISRPSNCLLLLTCCARATTGHAAAVPSPAMNCRRHISYLPLAGRQLTAIKNACERTANEPSPTPQLPHCFANST